MASHKRCPKCDARMTEGHMIDMGHGAVGIHRWQSGRPVKAWTGSIKLRKKDLREVTSHACDRCGFIENYLS